MWVSNRGIFNTWRAGGGGGGRGHPWEFSNASLHSWIQTKIWWTLPCLLGLILVEVLRHLQQQTPSNPHATGGKCTRNTGSTLLTRLSPTPTWPHQLTHNSFQDDSLIHLNKLPFPTPSLSWYKKKSPCWWWSRNSQGLRDRKGKKRHFLKIRMKVLMPRFFYSKRTSETTEYKK